MIAALAGLIEAAWITQLIWFGWVIREYVLSRLLRRLALDGDDLE